MKLEVGKKYRSKNGSGNFVGGTYSVLFSDDKGAFVEYGTDLRMFLTNYTLKYYTWEEVIEPKKGTQYMAVFQIANGQILSNTYETRKKAEDCIKNFFESSKLLAIIEVEWTEGQGL